MLIMKCDEDVEWGWIFFVKIELIDVMIMSFIGFNKVGDKFYMLDSCGCNMVVLIEVDIEFGEMWVLVEFDIVDIFEVVVYLIENII